MRKNCSYVRPELTKPALRRRLAQRYGMKRLPDEIWKFLSGKNKDNLDYLRPYLRAVNEGRVPESDEDKNIALSENEKYKPEKRFSFEAWGDDRDAFEVFCGSFEEELLLHLEECGPEDMKDLASTLNNAIAGDEYPNTRMRDKQRWDDWISHDWLWGRLSDEETKAIQLREAAIQDHIRENRTDINNPLPLLHMKNYSCRVASQDFPGEPGVVIPYAVTLTLPIWLPAKTLARIFSSLQRELTGGELHPISNRNLRIFSFVTNYKMKNGILGAGIRASTRQKQELLDCWNNHVASHFKGDKEMEREQNINRFVETYTRTERQLLRKRNDKPTMPG